MIAFTEMQQFYGVVEVGVTQEARKVLDALKSGLHRRLDGAFRLGGP